jgi:hypothetical protein
MMHSILIIGQSNMGGRGFREEVPPINNERLFVLRNGRWRAMYVPVNPDRLTSGINLVESFADAYAKEHNVDVGIIPCADGGTCLDQWQVGGLLFDHACYMAELASRTSAIAGVLWHQGESDCAEDRYPFYEEKLAVILRAFRRKLGLEDVPFLLGGLGDYLKDCPRGEKFKNYVHVNAALRSLAEEERRKSRLLPRTLPKPSHNMITERESGPPLPPLLNMRKDGSQHELSLQHFRRLQRLDHSPDPLDPLLVLQR